MKLWLAPLQGVTEYPFRNAWHRHFSGLDAAYTPFIPTIKGTKVRVHHLRDVLPQNNNSSLTPIPQLLSNNPSEILVMINALSKLGYTEINLNMGCPSPTVIRHRRGCGLMPFPDIIDYILKEVIPETDIKFSVKLRPGLKNVDELWRMFEVLNNYPIYKIILHPRLGIQMYEGVPDPDVFAMAAKRTSHLLVYNGDIKTLRDFSKLRDRFPETNEWMIGRGVLFNPFLPGIIKGMEKPRRSEILDPLIAFHEDLIQCIAESGRGERRLLAKLKEYWLYFSHWFADHETVWENISHSKDIRDIMKSIDKAFTSELSLFS